MKEKTSEEIQVVETQVSQMSEVIDALPTQIKDQGEYDEVYEVGKKVHALYKVIDNREKKITKPINDSLKQIRDMFRPFKTQVKAVEDDLKRRREQFIRDEEERKRKEEERIAKRVEKGTMREDTAVGKLTDIEESKTETRGGMTSVLVVEVKDIRQIPEEYLTVNESAIKAAHREGVEVPGVECRYEKRARA